MSILPSIGKTRTRGGFEASLEYSSGQWLLLWMGLGTEGDL